MFSMFVSGFITGVLLLILLQLSKVVFSYIREYGFDQWVGLLFLLIGLTFFTSCTKEEALPDLCGACEVSFDVPFEQDSNGYYRARLLFNSAGAARFNLDVYASKVAKDQWMNDTPNAYSIFEGNIALMEGLGVVQNSRLQHTKEGFTRRIVGPVLTKHIGDTLIVDVMTYWEGNAHYESAKNTLKFIIE